MDIWNEHEEAIRLKERFVKLKKEKGMNRAKFAKEFEVPGGDSMIYQHIKEIRPISMDAALAYAKGFNCSLDEISPRLAKEAERSASLLKTDQSILTNIEKIDNEVLKKDVPLISWVQAGDWCEAINNVEPGDAEDWLWCPAKHSEKTFALRVSGVSMFNPDPYAKHSFKDGD